RSMAKMYQDLYHAELIDGLQASLIDFMEKEAFAYNTLADGALRDVEDGVKLIELATIEDKIYSDQATYKQELMAYYASGLAEEGEVSGVFQSQLQATLDDLFTLNMPPDNRKQELRSVIAKTLEGMDTADLLYAALMQRRQYAELVDLRQMIGPRVHEVFVPLEDPQIYLVPRAYTRNGFDLIFGSGEIAELAEMMNLYETVIGGLSSETENAILRSVAQKYTSDYIARWSGFISALRLRGAQDWQDAQILVRALTNPSENPINRLAATLLSNTDLQVFLPADAAAPSADGAPAAPQLAPASYSAAAAAAFNIRTAFRPYLDAMRAEGDQKNQFDLLLTYARDVNLWLEQAAEAPNGVGSYLFEQYQKAESTNPLAVLHAFVSRSELDLIKNLGVSVVTLLDKSAMQFVYGYIDAAWQSQILNVYQSDLTQAFPFNASSANDMSLLKFTDLFAPEGALQNFEKTYLARFKTNDDVFTPRSTFLLGQKADLTDSTKTAFTRFGRITQTMFVDGKPLMNFGLRVTFMSNELSQLAVSSGQTLLKFQHGPAVWTDQIWPVIGTQDSTLDLRVFERARPALDAQFSGPWSWFRLVSSGQASLNPARGYVDAAFATGAMGDAILQFDSRSRYNPFEPQFFSGITIPQSLFNTAPQPVDLGSTDDAVPIEILKRWLERDPIAEEILVANRGRDLPAPLRLQIQQFLQSTNDYTGQLDGIFGSLTAQALVNWRAAYEQGI
ncbi:MAG: ImcF-related family protein, partial [Cypionkella sp.]